MNQISWICLLAGVLLTGICHGGDTAGLGSGPEWISAENLADYRARAATKEPDFEAFGWAVFSFEGIFYGVLRAKGHPEFVATTVNRMDSEIQLSGRSRMILNKGKWIDVAEGGTVTLRGEIYEITGGRNKIVIQIPAN